MSKAFELSRVFDYKWTVNWKFLDPETFHSPNLAVALLVAHAGLLFLFANYRWCASEGGLWPFLLHGGVAQQSDTQDAVRRRPPQSAAAVLVTLFSCNFLGVAASRTLHYQFYTWYFHALPLLLWHAALPTPARLVVWVGIELSFNIFPATPKSSALVQCCHLALLGALWRAVHPAAGAAKDFHDPPLAAKIVSQVGFEACSPGSHIFAVLVVALLFSSEPAHKSHAFFRAPPPHKMLIRERRFGASLGFF